MHLLEPFREHVLALPPLAKFAVVIAVIVGIPPIARRAGLPEMIGLLMFGVVLGPHVLGIFGERRPIAEFFAELGRLLLMFSVGLEIDVAQFRRARARAIGFGIATTTAPLLLGALYALAFNYKVIPAIVIGLLLASHTLLGLSVATRLGAAQMELVIVVIGATVVSDTLSLIVFALCVSIYTTGFSWSGFASQILEIIVFVPVILFGLSRAGAYVLNPLRRNEEAFFVVMLGIMAAAGTIADLINLPGIVGAFLAGVAVNAAAHDHPAKAKLEFFGKALFIPSFFIATGFLIDPVTFVKSTVSNYSLVAGIVAALLAGKWLAAAGVGRIFGYERTARLTMWALTLPQVAATLAAALVAYSTHDATGHPMLDTKMLNAVLVVILASSILGPLLTERFVAQMIRDHKCQPGQTIVAL